jgi:hypothetical protein
MGAGVRMGGAVGVAFRGDGGYADHRPVGELLLQLLVVGLAVGQVEPPAVVVDHDLDVIGVVEGRRAAIEGGVVEVPLRRSGPPNELGEVAPVGVVPGPAAFGGEVVLVPPLQLGRWRQRKPAGLLAADQIPAHRGKPRQRSGQSAATMAAVRVPQSKPARIARSISRASSSAMMPRASAACSPLRSVASDRKRVVPSREGRGRPPGSRPPPARGRPRGSCGCRRASRAAARATRPSPGPASA